VVHARGLGLARRLRVVTRRAVRENGSDELALERSVKVSRRCSIPVNLFSASLGGSAAIQPQQRQQQSAPERQRSQRQEQDVREAAGCMLEKGKSWR